MLYEQYPELDAFLLSMPGAVRDFQPVWQWDRYLVGGRQFAGLCRPGAEHAAGYAGRPLLNLKADPAEGDFYRRQYPDCPAFTRTSAAGSASGWTARSRRRKCCTWPAVPGSWCLPN